LAGADGHDSIRVPRAARRLARLTVVIPARDEQACIAATVEHLHSELRLHDVPHEIIVVDDGSRDRTYAILLELKDRIPELRPLQTSGPYGFGRAIVFGLDHMSGDAVVIMMADESDDDRDVVRYWQALNAGWDCVFGSRFIKGGGTVGYPPVKLLLNRLANTFLRLVFRIHLNDTTNAFKAYRREVIENVQPLLSHHFNLTVELPLKAVVRGHSYGIVPISWTNRAAGESKLGLKEMGSRYLYIVLMVFLEHHLARGDYRRPGYRDPREAHASRSRGRRSRPHAGRDAETR
jgi:dolichol-phosphate mannosyltransferase